MSINLAEDLFGCLSHLEPSDGTKAFALFETQTNPINPGICLKNGGAIGLPLSEGDAKYSKQLRIVRPFNRLLATVHGYYQLTTLRSRTLRWDASSRV